MQVSREELRFDFNGGKFDLASVEDRRWLGWILNQFLYGEVTGIQCGHWLYHAPSLAAAQFLAKQAGEELAHVRKILRVLSILGERPAPAHASIRFLSTGMMGGSWGEHVTLEMALGEGLVLGVFYALCDTIPNPEIHKILETATAEEEKHVEFGERETLAWLRKYPWDRKRLLAQALLQTWALRWMKRFVHRRIIKSLGAGHPVFRRFEAFFEHSIRCFELRMERLGLSRCPLTEMGRFEKWELVLGLLPRKLCAKWRLKRLGERKLLTATYLNDPILLEESRRLDQ